MFYSEIVRASHQIVTGTVTGSLCRYERGKETIATLVTFESLVVHRGQVGQKITLRFEGGSIGDDHLRIPLMPTFQIGKRYLVYVDGLSGKKVSPIVGFYQGAFEVSVQDGRETLIGMLGDELVGIERDRFVFAGEPSTTPANAGPEAVDAGSGYKPADPDVDAKEAAQKVKNEQEARDQMRPVPVIGFGDGNVPGPASEGRDAVQPKLTRSDAAPIIVPDQGLRMTASSLLSVPVEVK